VAKEGRTVGPCLRELPKTGTIKKRRQGGRGNHLCMQGRGKNEGRTTLTRGKGGETYGAQQPE